MRRNGIVTLFLTCCLVLRVCCEETLTRNAVCVSVGQHSRVSCYFSKNINSVHGITGIVLRRQPLSDNDRSPEIVAECHKMNGDPFTCVNKPGYRVHNISYVMAVDLLTENADHDGRYSCTLISEEMITYSGPQQCVLQSAVGNGISVSTVCDVGPQSDQSTVSCHFSEDITKVKEVTRIVLVRHSLTHPDSVPDIVVDCTRLNGDPFACSRMSGYRIVGNITKMTVVEIPQHGSQQEGRYSCVLRSERLVTYTEETSCKLSFSANEDLEPDDGGTKTIESCTEWKIALGTVSAIFGVFIVILTGVTILKRKSFRSKREKYTKTAATEPLGKVEESQAREQDIMELALDTARASTQASFSEEDFDIQSQADTSIGTDGTNSVLNTGRFSRNHLTIQFSS